MTVAVRASVSAGDAATASTTTLNVSLSAGSVNDWAVILVLGNSNTLTMATPSGWTVISGPNDNGTGLRMYLFGKKLTSGDISGGVAFIWSGTSRTVAVGHIYDGSTVDGTSPWGVPTFSANNATAAPTMSTSTDDSLVALFAASGSSSGAPAATVFAAHANDVAAATNLASGSNRRGIASHITTTSAGAYGGDTLTNAVPTSSVDTTIGLVINAPAGSPTPVSITSSSATSGTVASAAASVPYPSGISAGGLLRLWLANVISTAVPTAPPGWTLLATSNVRSDNYGYLFVRSASGTESGNVAVAMGAASTWAAIMTFEAATHDQISTASDATDGTTLVIPTITPTVADCAELAFVSNCTRPGTDTPGMTAPAGWNEEKDVQSNHASLNNIEVGLYSKQLAGQAGVAQGTAVIAVPGNAHSGLMFAVTSAPGSAAARHANHAWVAGAWVETNRLSWNGTAWV